MTDDTRPKVSPMAVSWLPGSHTTQVKYLAVLSVMQYLIFLALSVVSATDGHFLLAGASLAVMACLLPSAIGIITLWARLPRESQKSDA